MYEINQNKQLEVIRWLMYAWDGQWVSRTTAVYGPTEASKLDTRVRGAFGKVEMKALLALLGKKQADNLEDAAEMLKTYFGLMFGERGFQGRFLPVAAAPSGGTRLQVEVSRLIALDSLKKVAQAAGEKPDLACELLWQSWLDTLLPQSQLEVTLRVNGETDIYQIDSLSEAFSGVTATASPPLENRNQAPSPATSVAPPVANPTPAATFPPPFAAAPAPTAARPMEVAPAPTFPPPFATPPLPAQPAQELSTIAELLQLPMQAEVSSPSPVSQSNGTNGMSLVNPVSPPVAPAPAGFPPPPASLPESDAEESSSVPLGMDPRTGRPLFSSSPDFEARERLSKNKAKSPAFMSKLFVSKEGRELMAKGSGQPTVKVNSLAGNIDMILQRRLGQARSQQPGSYAEQIRVMGGPEGELQIIVGPHVFQSVSDVPAGPIRDILQQAVEEWSSTQ